MLRSVAVNGYRLLDAGCWMQDTGCRMLDTGCWMLDTGCKIRDARYGMMGRALSSIESLPLSLSAVGVACL